MVILIMDGLMGIRLCLLVQIRNPLVRSVLPLGQGQDRVLSMMKNHWMNLNINAFIGVRRLVGMKA
jgi:hypothetical protein